MKLKEIKTTNEKMPGICGICNLKINETSKYQTCRLSGSSNCWFTFKLYEIHTYISIICSLVKFHSSIDSSMHVTGMKIN